MSSLKSFFLKPSGDLSKNHKDYPYIYFPEIKMEITPKKFIYLDKKDISLLFTHESDNIFQFNFNELIKMPFLFDLNDSWKYYLNKKYSYTPYRIIPVNTEKKYYIFNIKNYKPSFIVYGFFEENSYKPIEIKKEYVFSNYIKIKTKNNYKSRMLLYYRYSPEDI